MEREKLIDASKAYAPIAFIVHIPEKSKVTNIAVVRSEREFGVNCVEIPGKGTAVISLKKIMEPRRDIVEDIDVHLNHISYFLYPDAQDAHSAALRHIGEWAQEANIGDEDNIFIYADDSGLGEKESKINNKEDTAKAHIPIDPFREIHIERFSHGTISLSVDAFREVVLSDD